MNLLFKYYSQNVNDYRTLHAVIVGNYIIKVQKYG